MADIELQTSALHEDIKSSYDSNKIKIIETYEFFMNMIRLSEPNEISDSIVNGVVKCLQLLGELDDKYCEKMIKIMQGISSKSNAKDDRTLKEILTVINEIDNSKEKKDE